MHIAVILPYTYRGGTLRGALNIARMLAIGAATSGDRIRVSFGHVDDPDLYAPDDFADLRELGVTVRPFKPRVIPGDDINDMYRTWLGEQAHATASEYLIFNDGVSNFEDAEFWLVVSDRLVACIPPHRPYALVVYDYIQRYVPEIVGPAEASWALYEQFAEVTRRAAFVMCTTQQTRRDCIAYVGVPAERVVVFPPEFDLLAHDRPAPQRRAMADPYILWTTNSTEHKNHLRLIDGLETYFTRHPDSSLKLLMTGYNTQVFSPHGKRDLVYEMAWPKKVRDKLSTSTEVRRRLRILGNISDAEYSDVLREAQWLLHGALYDNGTFSLVEAAAVGVPAISSQYPAIDEECRTFGLRPALFDPYEPSSLRDTLERALPRRAEYQRELPSRQALAAHSYKALAPQYWSTFRGSMEKFVS